MSLGTLDQIAELVSDIEVWKSRAEINGNRAFDLQDKLHIAVNALEAIRVFGVTPTATAIAAIADKALLAIGETKNENL